MQNGCVNILSLQFICVNKSPATSVIHVKLVLHYTLSQISPVQNHALSLFTVSCTNSAPVLYVLHIILTVTSLLMCEVTCSAPTSEAKCVKSRYINFTLMDFINHSAESHGD